MPKPEHHFSHRIGWLRAAVLGANDGIVSTASLLVGVAAANAGRADVVLAGVAGLVAGAMSMAAGEYVSVSSQADTEQADLKREQQGLEEDFDYEFEELKRIYVERGLEESLAQQVATQLMKHDALGAHARDELGLSEIHQARPLQAAAASAFTFAIGASLPLLLTILSPWPWVIPAICTGSLICLAILGAIAAHAGGASRRSGAVRVLFWGAVAMAATALVGRVFGTVVA